MMTGTPLKSCICVFIAVGVIAAEPAGSELVLHNFASPVPKGARPYSGMIRDAAGNLYGTTSAGGASGEGEVYRLSPTGHLAELHSFTGGADGAQPYSGVVADPQGNLYGTALMGGAFDMGVVYKIDSTGKFTVLYSFTGGADGGLPYAGVILDGAGNLYGTTYDGGLPCAAPGPDFLPFTESCVVVYKLDPAGLETVLYSFSQYAGTGYQPITGVVRDATGNLYGTASGGSFQQGVVYEVDVNGVETVLHSFTQPIGGNYGSDPDSSLIFDAVGNLYGTTAGGGGGVNLCCGTLYEVTQTGGFDSIFQFSFNGSNGSSPHSPVILDAQGDFYGTAWQGGVSNEGVLYEVNSGGTETVLYNFSGGADGGNPQSGLIRDPQGNFYGTTVSGGAGTNPEGVIFKVDVSGNETTLYTFNGKADGATPGEGRLAPDGAGDFYGVTADGGTLGFGVIYKVDAAGGETVAYNFADGFDGAHPQGDLAIDASGDVYGTSSQGGMAYGGGTGEGVIFQYGGSAGPGYFYELYTFTGGDDGGTPKSGVIRDASGTLYGTTSQGGTDGQGVVYKLPYGGLVVLHSFTGGADGGVPVAGVIIDQTGNLYGTTTQGGTDGDGVVYALSSAGQETVLHSFAGGTDGAEPVAGVVRDAAGNLYGTTAAGGAGGFGVVYKVDPANVETVLYTFTGGLDGAKPLGSVIITPTGNLFGTTSAGGADGKGVVYKLDTAGVETVLYSFTGPDGAAPVASLVIDGSGNLYGTTRQGGKRLGGVIFELKAQ